MRVILLKLGRGFGKANDYRVDGTADHAHQDATNKESNDQTNT
jgi:hypothetical protein